MTDYIPSMSQVEAWLDEPLYVTEAEIGKLRQLYSIDERRLQRLVQQIAADVAQNLQVLAEPEPERLTDEDLDELAWNWYSKTGSTWHQIETFRAYARAVLALWGNQRALDWQPIITAPRDGTRVIAWCDHEADPYFDEEDRRLTPYGAHVESCGRSAKNGVQIVVWGGELDEVDEVFIPEWWFVDDNDNWNYPANPTHWQPLLESPARRARNDRD